MPKQTPPGVNHPLDLIVPKSTLTKGCKSESAVTSSRPAAEEPVGRAEDQGKRGLNAPERTAIPEQKAPKDSAAEDRSEVAAAAAEAGQYLTFVLAGEEYGVGILDVREIIEYETLTRVPMTPGWVRGVLNLRGNVVPVIDLASKFGLPATEFTDRTCVVIVELEQDGSPLVMGVLVDRVSHVADLESDQIEPPPAFGTHIDIDYLLGMGRIDERFILLLDVDRVLASEELTEVGSVEEQLELAEEQTEPASQSAEGEKSGPDAKTPEGTEGPQTP